MAARKVSGIPSRSQQKFIFTQLIPAILREGGLQFVMEMWHATRKEILDDCVIENRCPIIDGVEHLIPKCNSVRCLGGTISVLKGFRDINPVPKKLKRYARAIGLTEEETYGLFFNWRPERWSLHAYAWPLREAEMFAEAETPLEKAQVAAGLLTRIATEGGACLHAHGENR